MTYGKLLVSGFVLKGRENPFVRMGSVKQNRKEVDKKSGIFLEISQTICLNILTVDNYR